VGGLDKYIFKTVQKMRHDIKIVQGGSNIIWPYLKFGAISYVLLLTKSWQKISHICSILMQLMTSFDDVIVT